MHLQDDRWSKRCLMKDEIIQQLQSKFDELVQAVPGESVEFWFARDLQDPLGYQRWESFLAVINKAIASCKTTGCVVDLDF